MKETVRMPFVDSIRKMEVYKRSYSVSLEVHKASLQFPQIEQYALASQIRRASKSICANLGEGFAKQKQSKAEFRRFILMAIGSCNEMIVWTDYCKDLNYINNEIWNKWNHDYEAISKMLHSLRRTVEA